LNLGYIYIHFTNRETEICSSYKSLGWKYKTLGPASGLQLLQGLPHAYMVLHMTATLIFRSSQPIRKSGCSLEKEPTIQVSEHRITDWYLNKSGPKFRKKVLGGASSRGT
jgi:hypothetical protein